MASFSPTDAAFEGFRLTREQPRAVLIWCAAFLVFNLGLSLLTLVWIGPELPMLQHLNQLNQSAAQSQDTQEIARVLAKLLPFMLVALPIEAVFYAVLNTAIYRAILRPQERGLGFFRLSGDEARMTLLAIAYMLLWLAALFAVSVIASIAVTISTVLGPALGALIGVAAGLTAFCATIWVFVRLSLAGPMTFQTKRLVLFESWPLTHDRFWPLLGVYLMAFFFGVIVLLLVWMMSIALMSLLAAATGADVSAMGGALNADMNTVGGLLRPPALVAQACSAVMITAFYVITLSPSAIAYKALAFKPEHSFD